MNTATTVSITEVRTLADPPSTRIELEVRNEGPDAIWLVADEWFIWHCAGQRIELSFQRTRMREGAQVFGYFIPEVGRIGPGENVRRAVELTWPMPLSTIWNSLDKATPDPGEYEIRVRIGYGLAPEPDQPGIDGDVETPVLRWQHESVSRPVEMTVPPYERGSQHTAKPGNLGREGTDLSAEKRRPGGRS